MGSSIARNVGIKNSNADFLVFLDADDQLHEKYLVCLHLMKFHNPECKIFSTKHFNIYENKEIIENSRNLKIFKSEISKLNQPILNYSVNPKLFCSSGICVEKYLMLNNLFPQNINVGEDIYTWLKIFKNNELVLYNKELIYIFKISENRSIDIFHEIPYYFKKIYEFQKFKKISYYIYFFISSLIYFHQTKHDEKLNKEFLKLIKSQSISIFFSLKIISFFIINKIYYIYKKIKFKKESSIKSIYSKNTYFLGFNYFLLLPGMPLIVLVFYISKKFELLADLMIMSSISIFFTSSVSLFARSYALIRDNFKDSLRYKKIKNIIFFPIFVFLSILIFVFGFEDYKVITIGILFVMYIWKKESKVQIYEVLDSYNLILKILLNCFCTVSSDFINIVGNTFAVNYSFTFSFSKYISIL